MPKILLRDARDYQIIFLALFLTLGVAMRDWSLRPEMVAVAIGVSLATQAGLAWVARVKGKGKGEKGEELPTTVRLSAVRLSSPSKPHVEAHHPLPTTHHPLPLNWRSPLITALGLSLLLRTDHLWTMALAAGLAIASKFFFKVNDKHFFNPANFGIIAALTLTPDAWVSPGQWGEEMWYALIFLGAGGIVLKRVGRWDTTGMFLGSYALLEAVRNVYLGWTWDVWVHRMSSGSLLLFALFMVTDPRSIPNGRPARLIWAGAIAILTFILRNQFYLSTAVFWALFALAPLTLVLDKVWAAPRFEWKKMFSFEANGLPQA